MSNLSDMLIFLRKRANLSQQELADNTSLTRSAVSMYETGQREPNLETLELFADYFNVDMNTLTGSSQKSASREAQLRDEDIMFALFDGDAEITDEMFEEVKDFARFIQERERKRDKRDESK